MSYTDKDSGYGMKRAGQLIRGDHPRTVTPPTTDNEPATTECGHFTIQSEHPEWKCVRCGERFLPVSDVHHIVGVEAGVQRADQLFGPQVAQPGWWPAAERAIGAEALDVERLARLLKERYGDAPFGIAVGNLSLDRFQMDAQDITARLTRERTHR